MDETKKLITIFEEYNEAIRICNDKIDEMFFIEYEDNYKSIFRKKLESIQEECNLRFDSSEAYRLFEKEIIKLIEIQKEKINDLNKKNMSNAMELLNQNLNIEYESIEVIAKNMFGSIEEKVNGYIVNNVNEIFMPKFFDLVYQQNYSLNRDNINEINRKLYLFIEESLNETKKIVSSKSKQIPEYLLVVAKLKDLNEYINANKLSETNNNKNETKNSTGVQKKESESRVGENTS